MCHTQRLFGSWLLLLLLLLQTLATALASVKVGAITCSFNERICQPNYCLTQRTKAAMSYLSVGCYTPQSVDDVWLRLRLLRKQHDRYETFHVDVSQNLCDYKRSNENNFFVNRVLFEAAEYARTLQCPLQGNVTLTRLPVMLYFAQGLFPKSDYIVHALLYKDDVSILNLNISLVIS